MGWVILGVALAAAPPAAQSRARGTAHRLAPPIEPAPDGSAARFILRAGRGNVTAFFTDEGFALSLLAPNRAGWGLHFTLDGARRVPPRAEAARRDRVSYFVGDDPAGWRVDLPTYERLVWEGVYAGIDFVVESRPEGIAYRFELEPGADPKSIRIRWEGATAVRARDGAMALIIETGLDEIGEHGLRCFEGGRDIDCRYRVDGPREVGFVLGLYEPQEPLVIDPTIEWSSFLGGASDDVVYGGMAVDGAGNAYVTGEVYSPDFPTSGGFDMTYGGGQTDAFVTKVDASGSSLAWSSFLGGTRYSRGTGVAVDASGNAYLTGYTESRDFPSWGGFDAKFGGVVDTFVTKVDATGSSLAWSLLLGGAGSDYGSGIAVDGPGNAYVTGHTDSSDFPFSGGFDATFTGAAYDAFVTKVDAAGSSLAWSSFLGGTRFDNPSAIAVDSSGNVYVTGDTDSSDFPSSGGFQTTFGGYSDAFVTKVDAAGSSLVWSSFLGGANGERGYGIAVDGSGNVYVTGYTASPESPSSGGFDSTLDGYWDAFVTKVDANGSSLAWSSFLGGADDEYGSAIAIDGSGNAYVTGFTSSSDFPSSGGFDTALGGQGDAFVTKVDATGSSLAWSSFLGGADDDSGSGIAVSASGTAWVAGSTTSSDFPSSGGFDTTYGGLEDAFVTRIMCVADDCDDGNPCTVDTCDAATGTCSNEPDVGARCDDGDACTIGDACTDEAECAGDPDPECGPEAGGGDTFAGGGDGCGCRYGGTRTGGLWLAFLLALRWGVRVTRSSLR